MNIAFLNNKKKKKTRFLDINRILDGFIKNEQIKCGEAKSWFV